MKQTKTCKCLDADINVSAVGTEFLIS